MAETQRFLRANGHWTSVYALLHENLGGEAETVVLTGGANDAVEEDDINGETSLQWKKVLQNCLPSRARRPKTLITTWLVTRSMEVGAHRRSVEVGDGIWCRGRKSRRGSRRSGRGGALRWLDARGRVGGAGERPKESGAGEHMVADSEDGDVLLGCTRVVESLHGRSTGSTTTRWGSLAGLGWLEARWSSSGATVVWCGAEARDAKQGGSTK
jgi:hypothetical protein